MLFRQGLNKQRNLPKEVLIAYKFCGQKLYLNLQVVCALKFRDYYLLQANMPIQCLHVAYKYLQCILASAEC